MISELLGKLTDLSTIIQGAAGSALFWIVLKVAEFAWPRLLRFLGRTTAIGVEKKLREYVYRRYTSRSGYINYAQGFMFSLSRAFRGLLTGLIFCCIALAFGSSLRAIWGICLAASIFYFASALIWLIPKSEWSGDPILEHWKRIGDLERELFGKVDKETQEYIEKFQPEENGAKQESAKAGSS